VQITKPTFIVAELPPSIAAWVRETRLAFEPAISHLPAEITLAGSSGVGPVSAGQSIESIQSKLEAALAGRIPFEAHFTGIGNFPGTDIFFASPGPEPFVALHRAIVSSGIAFGSSPHSYHPHCSLKGFTALRPGQREALNTLSVPAAPFTIRTVSVYEMDHMQPHLLFSNEG
jgi:2'-5' RNA ligase